jgi:hypothetical protein
LDESRARLRQKTVFYPKAAPASVRKPLSGRKLRQPWSINRFLAESHACLAQKTVFWAKAVPLSPHNQVFMQKLLICPFVNRS